MNNDEWLLRWNERDEEFFISFVNEVIQKLRKMGRLGTNKILKSIDGAEDISGINVTGLYSPYRVFHMSQFEVGYIYILNSNADWINIIMPVYINENHTICSYLRNTIYKPPHPQMGYRYWLVSSAHQYPNESITTDSYWDALQLCLKIPISLSDFNKFINWPNTNPLEVKE